MKITPEMLSSENPIPQEVEFKDAFIERYKELLGDDFDEFLKYSLTYARKAIRVNTLKISVADLKKKLENDFELTPVPWCKEGFWIKYKHGDRFDIGNLPEHQLGYFYVQDPASMIPAVVLDPQPGDLVLDMCAAPGSKTTQMAAMMQNEGVIIANDVAAARLKPLGLNLQRCGIANTIVTLRSNTRLQPVFDRVLVDAPCSATGTIRKSLKCLQMWSPGTVKKICGEQRGILRQAWQALKPGGTMVYSTCTHEPEENEGMVSWFLEKHPDARVEKIDLDIQRSAVITDFQGQDYDQGVHGALRIYPQNNDSEGFFVAKLSKSECQLQKVP
ncbi:MAG: RsmB/NOP family class I SAM-dependent RNA methyltransferase [Candidatus Woesearchaeota archaeon]|nr:RsmB/NOP family class I SAM-dependent RNA methyltransferase [Candidatus Woesearchaeota archaeon]